MAKNQTTISNAEVLNDFLRATGISRTRLAAIAGTYRQRLQYQPDAAAIANSAALVGAACVEFAKYLTGDPNAYRSQIRRLRHR